MNATTARLATVIWFQLPFFAFFFERKYNILNVNWELRAKYNRTVSLVSANWNKFLKEKLHRIHSMRKCCGLDCVCSVNELQPKTFTIQ